MQPIDQATDLFYSDDPEQLSTSIQQHAEGVVFDCDLQPNTIHRILAYHVNADEAPRHLSVRLFNMSHVPTTISYVAAIPQPTANYLQVGHQSTLLFMKKLLTSTWTDVELPPLGNRIIEHAVLEMNDLFAGMLELRCSGSTIRCSLVSTESPDNVLATVARGATFTRDGKGRRGKFELTPRLQAILRYTVSNTSSAPATYRLGTHTIQNLEHNNGRLENPLKGESGVFTTLKLEIANKTDAPAAVAFYQSAHGGDSTASYIVDDQLMESAVMSCPKSGVPARHKIKLYTIPAHATVFSTVVTMPDNASNSPVVLSLDRADQSANPNDADSLVSFVTDV